MFIVHSQFGRSRISNVRILYLTEDFFVLSFIV